MSLDDIGATLRQVRKEKKYSQQYLSEQLGISRASISAIENNTITEIGVRKIIKLCTFLGLELIVQVKRTRPTLQQLQAERDQQRRK